MKIKFYTKNANLIAGMTMRDETEPEDGNMGLHACLNMEDVIKNRRKLAETLHCSLDDFVCSRQTHSANFYRVTANDKSRGANAMDTAIPDTDALYTYEPNLLLCCFTADCVPVFLYHEESGLVGIIHSGWKGTVKEIVPKVLDRLIFQEGCNEKDLRVVIGASLSQNQFEVDRDVYEMYKELSYADDTIYWDEKKRKYHIDNQLVVKKQCERYGVPSGRIAIDRTCTYRSPDGFSYRQDKNCGRHLSFIMRKA